LRSIHTFSRKSLVALLILATSAMILSGCGGGKYKDGTYQGEGQGNNGPVKVTVTVQGGKIKTVAVDEHQETAGLSDAAISQVPQSIVKKQTWEVDTVSGATYTSKAIKEAVQKALAGAEK
jgi:urocanate reductase